MTEEYPADPAPEQPPPEPAPEPAALEDEDVCPVCGRKGRAEGHH